MSDESYVASLTRKGLNEVHQRVKLCDLLLDAEEAAKSGVEALTRALAAGLEGNMDGAEFGEAMKKGELQYETTIIAFDKARTETFGFLAEHGPDPDPQVGK